MMAAPRALSFEQTSDATLVVRLAGAWRLREGMPPLGEIERALARTPPPRRVRFDAAALEDWDSGVLTFLTRLVELCGERGIAADRDGLPPGIRRLLALAEAVPEKTDARAGGVPPPWLARVGTAALEAFASAGTTLAFIGDAALAFGRLIGRRARFRRSDVVLLVQQAGAEALPIVTLISFLVGTILAFVGAVQLEQFGAAIYVANLVGVGMVREMGAMMTAIVMAGRTGAAYAAQLGSMRASQEIDALTTMGIPPFDFLVLPRMIALCLMMPLLCLYSDALGILGGAAIGIGMLGISPALYFQQTADATDVGDLAGGVFKASVYGVLIALAGCMRGMQAGSSAAGVGDATTSAVVTGIVWIITACGIFAVVFYVLGI
jgi:phospholipid/cholesterol/gamma-HCH transport system permease protein